MELLHAVVGPLQTNVYVLADPASREAIAIDTAIPCLAWIAGSLEERGLDAQAHRQQSWPLGPRRRQRRGVRAHRRPDRRPPARRAPAHRPAADVGAVRDPAVACRPSSSPRAARSGSARSGCACSTRRATPRARCACCPPTTACCSAATRCSRAAGAGSTCPGGSTRAQMVESLDPAGRARGPPARAARPRRRDDDRPRARRGWTSSARGPPPAVRTGGGGSTRPAADLSRLPSPRLRPRSSPRAPGRSIGRPNACQRRPTVNPRPS